jgi:hypothetical protein
MKADGKQTIILWNSWLCRGSNPELQTLESTCCRKESENKFKYAIHIWDMNKMPNAFVDKKLSNLVAHISVKRKHKCNRKVSVLRGLVTNEFPCNDPTGFTIHRRNIFTNHPTPDGLVMFRVRSGVYTAVTMKNGVFWDVTPCGSCKTQRFGGT